MGRLRSFDFKTKIFRPGRIRRKLADSLRSVKMKMTELGRGLEAGMTKVKSAKLKL